MAGPCGPMQGPGLPMAGSGWIMAGPGIGRTCRPMSGPGTDINWFWIVGGQSESSIRNPMVGLGRTILVSFLPIGGPAELVPGGPWVRAVCALQFL